METVVAAARLFSADCLAIREHLRSVREDEAKRAPGVQRGPAATNPYSPGEFQRRSGKRSYFPAPVSFTTDDSVKAKPWTFPPLR